jgi:hypothetical protein
MIYDRPFSFNALVPNDSKVLSLPSSEFKLYMLLLTYSGGVVRKIYPCNEDLAGIVGVKTRRLQVLLGSLQEKGFISIERKRNCICEFREISINCVPLESK